MSQYLLGVIPFKTVYFHGIVRDEKGRKISKSLGNNIDPVDMALKYGSDAVRMGLIVGTGPGSDSKISEQKIRGYKNFANKLWNITRFVLSSTENTVIDRDFSAWSKDDKKIMDEFGNLLTQITKEMDEYKYYLVAEKLYAYVWHEFADIILEESKSILAENVDVDKKDGGNEEEKTSRKQLLLHILEKSLRALHPFTPFVTEEIWKDIPLPAADKKLLMIEDWPR